MRAPSRRLLPAVAMAVLAALVPWWWTAAPSALAPAAPAPHPTFAERIAELAAMRAAIDRLAANGHGDAAVALDQRATDLLDRMAEEVDDLDRLSLEALAHSALEPPPSAACRRDDTRGRVERRILAVTLRRGLERRLSSPARDPHPATRRAIDAVIARVLALLPADADLAEDLVAGLLADGPWLRPEHADGVVDLVAAGAAGRFRLELAGTLLAALRRNLRASGLPAGGVLADLLALLPDRNAGDGDPDRRLAAARRLLADDRFRPLVLAAMQLPGELRLARQLARAALLDGSPASAFDVVATAADAIAPADAGATTWRDRSLLLAGERERSPLVHDYTRRLDAGVDAPARALLVAIGGLRQDATGVELAELALARDPDPDVRLRAVFALTSSAHADRGAAAIEAALDDPGICADEGRRASLALAAEQLARTRPCPAVRRDR